MRRSSKACRVRIAVTVMVLATAASAAQAQANARGGVPFDIVIEHGHIIDGTGSPWYAADIGIRDGRIAAIGQLSGAAATRRIDAHGLVVAPGFIDMLGQSELTILVNPHLPSKIYQGITTEITGEGSSAAPLDDSIIAADRVTYQHFNLTPDWRTLGQYFARLERQGMGINLASYVGATQVRRMVLGDVDRKPSAAELDSMRALVRAGMEDGAVGVSTSLQYAPAPYATTEELIALAGEASKYGGVYATHMRSEGAHIFEAIDEAVRIGREARIPVEIWHLKAAGKAQWGLMPRIVAKIDAARRSGVEVGANTYAYPAWFNSMSAFVPPWAHDGGDAKMIERLRDPAMRQRIKHDMLAKNASWENEWQEIPGAGGSSRRRRPESRSCFRSRERRSPRSRPSATPIRSRPCSTFSPRTRGSRSAPYSGCPSRTSRWRYASRGPRSTTIRRAPRPTESSARSTRTRAPTARFPESSGSTCARTTCSRLEDAIRKFSALPAQRMRLADRGVLKKDMWADIVVFDPAHDPRRRDVREAESALGRDAVRPRQRRSGDRRWKIDRRTSRKGPARLRLPPQGQQLTRVAWAARYAARGGCTRAAAVSPRCSVTSVISALAPSRNGIPQ